MKRFIISMLILSSISVNTSACFASENAKYENNLKYAETISVNPLCGFTSWEDSASNFPHTMEYYSFPLNEVQKGYNDFDWSVLEDALNKAKGNGNQAVIRFYIDYPGEESGIPSFLFKEGINTYSYNLDGGEEICADYNDKKLQKALLSFISAFGKKYDGDARIGFIECGLLGFWGEWHTYPYNDWYPSYDVYRIIGQAFDNSFNKTKIMAGEITAPVYDMNIGCHDDMFGSDSDYYYGKMKENNIEDKWMKEPIGGEIAPAMQDYCFESKSECDSIKKYSSMLHTSWMLNAEIENYSGDEKKNAEEAQKCFGYKFTIENVSLENNIMSIKIKNTGNAPFYYPWNIVMRITDKNGNEIKRENVSWNLTDIKELNKSYIFKNTIYNSKNYKGCKISLKVINPMENGKNVYFANEEQQSDGWINLVSIN